jgi:hypothetical protein
MTLWPSPGGLFERVPEDTGARDLHTAAELIAKLPEMPPESEDHAAALLDPARPGERANKSERKHMEP